MTDQNVQIDLLPKAAVSVVIPCYQSANTIIRALESVLNQTLQVTEIILVDDASNDATSEVLHQLAKKYPSQIKIITFEVNKGVADARNAAWDCATQPYIAFLDADDAWHPQKIEIQYKFMMEHPELAMSGHGHRQLSAKQGLPDWQVPELTSEIISKRKILLSNRFITPSVMLKRDIPFRFAKGKRHMEDHLLWSEIICAGLPVAKLLIALAVIYKFSYGVAGLSGDSKQMRRGEMKNYQQLFHEGYIGSFVMLLLFGFLILKAARREVVIATKRIFSPTSQHILGYMTLTYSIPALLILLGIVGKFEMAAEVAIVQGATLATFYVFSGDARHLILAEKIRACNVIFFRMLLLLPLAFLSYFMSIGLGDVEAVVALGIVSRRGAEWLAEVHVTEIERKGEKWQGLPLQLMTFLMLITQLILTHDFWFIWVWALSPIIFSFKFLIQAEFKKFDFMRNAHVASTAIMGTSNFALRVLIVGLAGKVFSGMLFPAVAIGSFAGTMFANVAGPTMIRRGLIHSRNFKVALVLWSLLGFGLFLVAETVFQKTLGLSIMGGGIMIYAQQSRLMLLKENHTLGLDTIIHLALICLTPIVYSIGGVQWLTAIYLINALLAWIFYNGSQKMLKLEPKWRSRFLFIIVLMLILPIFFQLRGTIYLDSGPLGMVDSGGNVKLVPLPISLLACYIGLIFFVDGFEQTKPAILTIASMFFLLIFSSLVTGQEKGKLILLIQYIIPTVALLVGISLANLDRNLIAKVFLYFLLCFVPFQLVSTWIQGNLALTHYLYLFSVYQNYQYVPLVIVAIYLWALIELYSTHKKWLLIMAPWMGFYVAAGNSILAVIALIVLTSAFCIYRRDYFKNILLPFLIIISIGSYFYLNSKIATHLKHNIHHGVFVGKLFNRSGEFIYGKSTNVTTSTNSSVPVNIEARISLGTQYIKGITENPTVMFLGHATPPPRSEMTSAHNYYLDIIYNFGLIAVLPVIALIFYTLYFGFKYKHKDSSLIWLVFVVLFIVLVDNNFKVTLRQPYPAIVTYFLWGILLSIIKSNSESNSRS